MTPLQRAALVFVLAFAALSFNSGRTGLAAGWLDPVGRVAPQDEAVYSATALEMLRSGDWLTPRFLGRYVLYKPPLTYWLSAAGAAVFGPKPFALRLPSLLAAALTVALVFRIVEHTAGVWPAVAAALLALQSPLFFAVARRNLMDAPLTACFALAAWLLIADEKRARPVALGIVCGAAILIKSIAGLLVLAMVLAVLLVRRQRVALLLAVTAGVAAPWFVFQAAVHPHWLWRELVLSEILGFGTAAPVQTSQENHLLFYVRRLFFTDPILPVMALMGSLRGRPPLVIAIWLGMVVAGLLAFSYRNATYLVPAIPAAAILALRTPQLYRQGALAAALLCGTFVLRAAAPGEPAWGLAYGPHRIASLAGLERYGAEHPGGELFLVSPDEDFAATLIPGIRRVRYVYLAQPPAAGPPPPLDFRGLGIIVTVDEFLNLDRHIGRFRARLRKADFTADDPIGTVVLAPSTADLERLIAASPGRDFSLPRSLGLQSAHHELSIAGHRVFFTARRP